MMQKEYMKVIKAKLPMRDLVVQMMEECGELTQALGKLYRNLEGCENHTPVGFNRAYCNAMDELKDVLICAACLGLYDEMTEFRIKESYKWQRWAERLEGKTDD